MICSTEKRFLDICLPPSLQDPDDRILYLNIRIRLKGAGHPARRALPRPGPQEVVRNHRGDAGRPRRLPHHLQHKAVPPGSRHEGQNAPQGLHRWTAKEGKCQDKLDQESRPTRPARSGNCQVITVSVQPVSQKCQTFPGSSQTTQYRAHHRLTPILPVKSIR